MNTSLYSVPALYDAEFGAYRADHTFYAAATQHHAGAWLEPGCGTGRLFGQHQPAHYIGLDTSADMLQAFRQRHPRAPLVRGTMTHLPFAARSFALCTLAYNVVQHLMTPEALLLALREAARVSNAVALDVFMPPLPGMERWDDEFSGAEVRRGPQGQPWHAQERTRLDKATRVQRTELRFLDAHGVMQAQHGFERRLWEAADILNAAAGAGLVVRWLWGDVFGEPWTPRSPRLMALFGPASGQ